MKIGAIELGGTKIVLGLFNEKLELLDSKSIKTTNPEQNTEEMAAYFSDKEIDRLGIGSFGPIELDKASPRYGEILSSPKLAWQGFNIVKALEEALDVPCFLDTDVNTAALAEAKLGIAKGLSSCVYFTIGTGIGGGVFVENGLLHGLQHPELGHMLLKPHGEDPDKKGICPYHVSCAEGLASGPAMKAKWNTPAENLPFPHKAWEIEAHYIAQLCVNAVLCLSCEKIVLGGGVMQRKELFPLIRKEFSRLMNGYIQAESLSPEGLEDFIVPPKLFPLSGLVGAACLTL